MKERDELKIIYVVAEGEGTEYDYLGHIDRVYGRRLGFRIKPPSRAIQRNGLTPRRVVEEAVRIMAQEPDIHQVWALFDHDGRSDIPQACAEARRKGVQTAFSHPAIELWLLLHFRNQLPAAQDGRNDLIVRSSGKPMQPSRTMTAGTAGPIRAGTSESTSAVLKRSAKATVSLRQLSNPASWWTGARAAAAARRGPTTRPYAAQTTVTRQPTCTS